MLLPTRSSAISHTRVWEIKQERPQRMQCEEQLASQWQPADPTSGLSIFPFCSTSSNGRVAAQTANLPDVLAVPCRFDDRDVILAKEIA